MDDPEKTLGDTNGYGVSLDTNHARGWSTSRCSASSSDLGLARLLVTNPEQRSVVSNRQFVVDRQDIILLYQSISGAFVGRGWWFPYRVTPEAARMESVSDVLKRL